MCRCCLRVAELQQLGNDVELCTGATRFPSAELATALERMAGWAASVGIASPAVCEANLSSHAKRSLYDVPDWKHREAAPSPARRTDRDRAERRRGGGVAVRALGGWSVGSVCRQRNGAHDQQRGQVRG